MPKNIFKNIDVYMMIDKFGKFSEKFDTLWCDYSYVYAIKGMLENIVQEPSGQIGHFVAP